MELPLTVILRLQVARPCPYLLMFVHMVGLPLIVIRRQQVVRPCPYSAMFVRTVGLPLTVIRRQQAARPYLYLLMSVHTVGILLTVIRRLQAARLILFILMSVTTVEHIPTVIQCRQGVLHTLFFHMFVILAERILRVTRIPRTAEREQKWWRLAAVMAAHYRAVLRQFPIRMAQQFVMELPVLTAHVTRARALRMLALAGMKMRGEDAGLVMETQPSAAAEPILEAAVR